MIHMKKDIILAGVGGQGILSIAAVIGSAALSQGLHLKQSEVHGMSQRGGDVHANLRISDKVIHSDLIPYGQADIIISVEPMESLRYLPWLSKDGWLVSNSVPYVNIANYPEIEEILRAIEQVGRHVLLDADQAARDLGAVRSANMVILGAASPFLGIDADILQNAIRNVFRDKGEDVVRLNLEAFNTGLKFALGSLN
jgi:indolepyruvate ferredoxin oxidoreductase beta subunit